MKFTKGQSGNPNGRPTGALNKRTQLAAQIEQHADKLIDKLVELALGGDIHALRFALERILPKASNEQKITLPESDTLNATPQVALKGILEQLAGNEVSISQAKDILTILSNPKVLEANDAESYFEIRKQLDEYLAEHKREF